MRLDIQSTDWGIVHMYGISMNCIKIKKELAEHFDGWNHMFYNIFFPDKKHTYHVPLERMGIRIKCPYLYVTVSSGKEVKLCVDSTGSFHEGMLQLEGDFDKTYLGVSCIAPLKGEQTYREFEVNEAIYKVISQYSNCSKDFVVGRIHEINDIYWSGK